MDKTFYQKNIKQAQKKLKDVLASDSYKHLTEKQKVVADCILNTIITSEFLTCFKSNRTISAETNTPTTSVNQTRLKLAKLEIVDIHEMPNGKRANKKYFLTLHDMKVPRLDYKFKLKTNARKHMAGFLAENSLTDDTKLECISKLDNLDNSKSLKNEVKMIKGVDRHYIWSDCYVDGVAAKYQDEPNKKQSRKVNKNIEAKLQNVNITEKGTKSLMTLVSKLCVLGRALEGLGFAVVPYSVDGLMKCSFGEGVLRNKSSFNRVETLDKVLASVLMGSDDEWIMTFFSDKTKCVRDLENKGKKLHNYQSWLMQRLDIQYNASKKYNGLGVEMPRGMVCLDIDDPKLYYLIKGLVPDGYWTKTKRGYHCFIWDKQGILDNFKIDGVDILRGKQKVIFAAYDRESLDEIYEYISGDIENIGQLRADFKNCICGTEETYSFKVDIHSQTIIKPSNTEPTGKKLGFQLPATIENHRNNTLYRFGRSLMGKGYDTDYVSCAIETVNSNPAIMPNPLDDMELKGIIKSATKKKDRSDFVRFHDFESR